VRVVIGSLNVSSTSTVAQILNTTDRVAEAQFKARKGNVGMVYVADDSTVSATNGWETDSADTLTLTFSNYINSGRPATVAANTFWVFGTDANDDLDYVLMLET
jgi:phosphoribosylformimino-5-aminoimidazole carboxamide ribonucleotide (ProFAR) isomerase